MNRSKIESLNCWPMSVKVFGLPVNTKSLGLMRPGFTWNPITGCSHFSPGCDNCWANRMAHRLKGRYGYPVDEPFRPTFHPDRLGGPAKRKNPAAVAVGWMGDLFHAYNFGTNLRHEDGNVRAIFKVMRDTPQHIYFILTRRPEGMAAFLERNSNGALIKGWPFQNVAVGVSVENDDYRNRIEELLKIQAAMRYVSCEPLLGGVDVRPFLPGDCLKCGWPVWATGDPLGRYCCRCDANAHLRRLDWVIAGGESGPKARPMHPDWVRSLRDQCAASKTPFMLKKNGLFLHMSNMTTEQNQRFNNHKYWAPEGKDGFFKVGQKNSGRLLDGAEHMECPERFGRIEAKK